MKKVLRFMIVISILFSLLAGNISAIAVNVENDNTLQSTSSKENENANNNEKDTATDDTNESEPKDDANESEPTDNSNGSVTTDSSDNSNQSTDQENSGEGNDDKVSEETSSGNEDNNESDEVSSKSTSSSTNGTENNNYTNKGTRNISTQENENLNQISNSIEEPEIKTGKLFINIDLRLPQSQPDLNVSLNKQHTSDYEKITEKSYDGEKAYYTYDNLNPGIYILSISGNGYQKFTQNIEIQENMTSELSLINGHDSDNLSIVESKQVGVIGIGDIYPNGQPDGIINSNDETEMVNQIESRKYNSKYDLNQDGKIDIIDLSYISINKDKGYTGGKISYIANIDLAEAKITSDIGVVEETNGTLEDLLKNNEKYVTLKPTQGEISSVNPVEITLDLGENNAPSEAITIAPSANSENNIESGIVTVETVEGDIIEAKIAKNTIDAIKNNLATINSENVMANNNKPLYKIATLGDTPIALKAETTKAETNALVTIDNDGTIVINLGNKVAVKKVTIKVTGTKSNKLADISKVEFLNGMDDRIPAPQLDIPTNVTGIPGSEQFTVSWDSMKNVTGYEVSITSNGITEHIIAEGHTVTIESFNNDKIVNYTEYEVKVQSINGEWKSGYSRAIKVTPKPDNRPEPPDNLKLTGGNKEISATWKNMKSTQSYNVYYRLYETGNYIKVAENIPTNSYTITGLAEKEKYQVYVTGVNELGESKPSIVSVAETSVIEPAKLPKYKLINTATEEGKVTNHITNATLNKWSMVDSPLDSGKTALGVVDNNFRSYYQADDWDVGGHYTGEKTPTIEFDNYYTMSYFTMAQIENLGSIEKAHVMYWDKSGNKKLVEASQVVTRKDDNGRDYTVIKLDEPITTNKINIGVGRGSSYIRKITIAEMCFYYDDSLERDINALYADQMHVTLKDNVTSATIDELQKRLDTPDEVSGEYNPEKENLQKEIDTAREILNNKNLNKAVQIDTTVTSAKDGHITFKGGLNAWQPLGVVAHGGETITIYVGNPNKKIGDNTNLQLISTQYHPEAAYWKSNSTPTLKVGKNEITIPKIGSLDTESGGSLYINYTGNNPNEVYGVRVSGGHEIPVLDLTKVTTEQDKKTAVKTYVEELEKVVPQIESEHNKVHKGSGKSEIDRNYVEKDCILGATEIVLDQMMYSVSSKRILAGLGDGTIDEKTEKLYNSLVAMSDMVDLFYSHKGLTKDPEAEKINQYPSSRLNIRYHRMFAGAFMYAGGQHIGIEWNEVAGLSQGNPIVTNAQGKYVSGNYFGWGIAHEIGHIINESAYVHAEVTNNYFSVLAQAQDTNESVRFQYPEVYKKVTSGTIGKASNVFTQLGLYWQLHLAYDKGGYNFKMFNTYQEQYNNLVFSRMDTYARMYASLSAKDKPAGVKVEEGNAIGLVLDSNSDNNLMRLACAATKKNLLEFFERWGMVPNEQTIAFAEQFEKETKAIYYINDEARAYQLAKKSAMVSGTTVVASLEKEDNSNQVKIKLGNNNQSANSEAMLGYEIIRSYWDNDKEVSRPVAFVTADNTEYIDTIETVNNRVFTYKVIGYDKYLNETKELVLDPVKVSHDGSLGKDDWVIETNLVSDEDSTQDADDNSGTPCEPEKVKAISKIANKDYSDDYEGTAPNNQNGEIIISLDEVKTLVGLKYKAGNVRAITDYEIQISTDKSNWETVKVGKFRLDDNKTQTVYFNKDNDDRLYTYRASYVKLVITDQKVVSIAELDLLGETGDNVELVPNGIGKLTSDLQYGTKEQVIPAGSIVFTGTYKGNPAYNVVKLWNENNEIVEGSQIILADEPAHGELGEVSEGIWIYWIEPTDTEAYNKIPKSVRAELYRVDNAETNEGERLTSDTLRVSVPSKLPSITLDNIKTLE